MKAIKEIRTLIFKSIGPFLLLFLLAGVILPQSFRQEQLENPLKNSEQSFVRQSYPERLQFPRFLYGAKM